MACTQLTDGILSAQGKPCEAIIEAISNICIGGTKERKVHVGYEVYNIHESIIFLE